MAKVGKIEYAKRVELIIELITSGISEAKIVQYIAEHTDWGVNERQIRGYKSKAIKYFEERSDINRKKQIGLAIRRFEHILSKAIKDKEYSPAIAAQKAIGDLFGLNAPTKIDVTDKTESTIEDLEAENKQLEEQLKQMNDQERDIKKTNRKQEKTGKDKGKK
jgi:hypothetical protein